MSEHKQTHRVMSHEDLMEGIHKAGSGVRPRRLLLGSSTRSDQKHCMEHVEYREPECGFRVWLWVE